MAKQTIEIMNDMGYEVDEQLLGACLKQAARWMYNGDMPVEVVIVLDKRVPDDAPAYKHPGWLEYSMGIHYGNDYIRIGAVRRTRDAEIEFHS